MPIKGVTYLKLFLATVGPRIISQRPASLLLLDSQQEIKKNFHEVKKGVSL
jgi:hypothetical protein